MKKFLFVFLFWTLVCGGTLFCHAPHSPSAIHLEPYHQHPQHNSFYHLSPLSKKVLAISTPLLALVHLLSFSLHISYTRNSFLPNAITQTGKLFLPCTSMVLLSLKQLSYPFICWWTSRLLPCPGYYTHCCDEHWGTCVSFNSGFLSVYAQQWDC